MKFIRGEFRCSDGQRRTYGKISSGVSSPDVFVWLHGSTQSGQVGRRFTAGQFDVFASLGYTVLYPDGVGRHWNDGRVDLREKTRALGTDDVLFLSELIEHYRGDNGRVFGAGYSNGGQMILRLLFDAPALLTRAAVFAATQPIKDNFLCSTEDFIPTPLLLMHGVEDPIAPFHGGRLQLFSNACRGEVLSFERTLALYSALNTGVSFTPPPPRHRGVELYDYPGVAGYALHGVGHVVPVAGAVQSEFLGPTHTDFLATDYLIDFFQLR
ncbi:poly(3-hydroxyalkanoate) depolymerase [Corynebacterium felinum]|uniref:Polyhydroxybutyrate depolymerase n=1 Tax=Corynebacterium felinum TaxID=131318 RepID=A0ABU2B681_9CORY|nr:poly(3-hydroxyalkanoate) depolymerase [Corynebacterium felinum]MDF5821213.1 poly(3-hydroxyalkanoate) depolymerase [Corynebacterium felinum]MDR7353786.1 polyhydroxybutyrate depolymerase [Corynebacterium felinum]WJY95965.1 Alpha/beta hydrolase family protein [Corynebacterium felinum]